jgi:hypothetical protein
MRGFRIPRPFSFFLLFLAFLLSVRPVAAHGDGAVLRLSNAPAGPFVLDVWTYPGYLIPGTVHFSVSVLEAASGEPMPATAVFVEVTPLGEQHHPIAPVNGRATLDFQTLFHESYLDIQEPGRYEVTVQAAASAEQQGEVTFEIEVASGTGLKVMIVSFLGVTGIIGVWFVREGLRTWGIERWVRGRKRNN